MSHIKTVNQVNRPLNIKRKMLIQKALSISYDLKQLCNYIIDCNLTSPNIENNTPTTYDNDLQSILSDLTQIDYFLHNYYNLLHQSQEKEYTTNNTNTINSLINKKTPKEVNNA
jgi:hypothetical protein